MSYMENFGKKPYENKPNDNRQNPAEENTLIANIEEYIKKGDPGIAEKLFSVQGDIARVITNREIKTSQIRKFYSEILNIDEMVNIFRTKNPNIEKDDFNKLKIKLALLEPFAYYNTERNKKTEIIKKIIVSAISVINKEEDPQKWIEYFNRFKEIYQVIVAYSKEDKKGDGGHGKDY